MSGDTQTYDFSSTLIARRNKVVVLLLLIIAIGIPIGALLQTCQYFCIMKLVHVIIFVPFILGIGGVTLYVINRLLKGTKLIISDDCIKRISGKSQEEMLFKEIISVELVEGPSGNIYLIKVRTSPKSMDISGYEKMDAVSENIQANISDKSIISRRKTKVDWSNPYVGLFIIIPMALVLMLFRNVYTYHSRIYEIVYGGLFVIFGLTILMTKPLSKKSGVRFKSLDILIGLALFALGILRLIKIYFC